MAIEIKPDYARAYNNRAWTYLKLGKFELGLSDAERAVELAPNDSTMFDTRGRIYLALGRRQEAATDLKRAVLLKTGPDGSREPLHQLGVSSGTHEKRLPRN